MFKFDNTHIFTGYLKQLLSSINLPTCRIYTKEFADYLKQHGKEDARVIESFDTITYSGKNTKQRAATRVAYLKGNELYGYFWNYLPETGQSSFVSTAWRRLSSVHYDINKSIPGLTRVLNSPGSTYDSTTHEYLGDYLRFMRDYYGINLMSLYNCFNNKICNNLYYPHSLRVTNPAFDPDKEESKTNSKHKEVSSIFDSQDQRYRIYAFPVKLLNDYTIAIDCSQGLEMFCGLYTTTLDTTDRGVALITKTYKKFNRTFFNRPFLYNQLSAKYWNLQEDIALNNSYPNFLTDNGITRWDIVNREQDLKLFIKVPASCKSSITVLEGDFRGFNDATYKPVKNTITGQTIWEYHQNNAVINFGNAEDRTAGLDVNTSPFTPISKLQLLAFNTEESYPFADRLIEYLCNSAITPIDEIADNIKRAQKVMSQNNHYFKINGLWEDKMQKIIYDYLINAGPIKVENEKLTDTRRGYHANLGHTSKSTLYDVLGYIDKEAEKWYASWKKENNKATVQDSIQNVDIYDGLYDV